MTSWVTMTPAGRDCVMLRALGYQWIGVEWIGVDGWREAGYSWPQPGRGDGGLRHFYPLRAVPSFSTRPGDAWSVVQVMEARGYRLSGLEHGHDGQWRCWFEHPIRMHDAGDGLNRYPVALGSAGATMPEAVCRSALWALGVDTMTDTDRGEGE